MSSVFHTRILKQELQAAEDLKAIKESVDAIRGLKQLCQVTKQRVSVYKN